MVDATVKSLATTVVQGRLTDAVPLLDRLKELDDPRWRHLGPLLGEVLRRAEPLAAPFEVRPGRSEEESRYRRDERCYRAFALFARDFRALFWLELSEKALYAQLDEAARALDAPKQAARLAEGDGAGAEGEEMEDFGQPHGMSPR